METPSQVAYTIIVVKAIESQLYESYLQQANFETRASR